MMFVCAKLLSVITCVAVVSHAYDYNKYDFCSFDPCEVKGEKRNPTGCVKNCKQNSNVDEWTENREEFRKAMLDTHNELRQRVASGAEKNEFLGTASNMNVLKYDLNCEHLARCWLHSKYGVDITSTEERPYHDECSWHPVINETTGQNLATINDPTMYNTIERLIHFVNEFYSEHKHLTSKSDIDNFTGGPHTEDAQYGHFTSMIWAQATHMGCASGCSIGERPRYGSSLCCDYISLQEPLHYINCIDKPVFLRGPPCSKCDFGWKCNKRYDALCGEEEPIPVDELLPLGGMPGGDETGPEGGGGGGPGEIEPRGAGPEPPANGTKGASTKKSDGARKEASSTIIIPIIVFFLAFAM